MLMRDYAPRASPLIFFIADVDFATPLPRHSDDAAEDKARMF